MSRLAFVLLFCAGWLLAQQATEAERKRSAQKAFAGTWKGECADGKDFVIVTLVQNEAEAGQLEGTIRLANMRGGDDGRCQIVVDPPSEKHALKITGARVQGSTLTFQGSKRMEFEMTVDGAEKARLKFLGTASEENPWALKRTK